MLKEIVTKAIICKGRVNDVNEVIIDDIKGLDKAIGCWVINHHYLSKIEDNNLYITGFYDIHLWYGINNNSDTLLYKKTIEYKNKVELDASITLNECELKLGCREYPNCKNIVVNGEKVIVSVSKDILVDVIGETKLFVQVSEEYNKEININPNYLK